jgi:hypothetical protein
MKSTYAYHIIRCGVSTSTILLHIIPPTARFLSKLLKINIYFNFLYVLLIKYFLFYKVTSEILHKCAGLHVKYPLFLWDVNWICIFSRDCQQTQISNFMNTRPVEFELFPRGQTDGQRARYTDMTSLIVAFRDFADAFKIQKILSKLLTVYFIVEKLRTSLRGHNETLQSPYHSVFGCCWNLLEVWMIS